MTTKVTIKSIPITRMDCPTCIPILEREIMRLEGVDEVRGNFINKILKVTYNSKRIQLEDIEATIERLGYRIAYKKYPGIISRLRERLRGEKEVQMLSLTDADFPGKVLHAFKPVAVLFLSPICPICHVLKKQFKEIAKKVGIKAELYEMDITSTDTYRKYDILSIPSILIFRKGQLSERFGILPHSEDIIRALGVSIEKDQRTLSV